MNDRRLKLLFDVIAATDAAIGFTSGISIEAFGSDLMRRSAVERQFEVMGEAAARLLKLDAALARRLPDLRLAVDMRNRLIHGYDSVDPRIVYRAVMDDLPALRNAAQALLDELSRPA